MRAMRRQQKTKDTALRLLTHELLNGLQDNSTLLNNWVRHGRGKQLITEISKLLKGNTK